MLVAKNTKKVLKWLQSLFLWVVSNEGHGMST